MPERIFDAEYIRAYFHEVDQMNPVGLLAWYGDEGRFRFANQDAVQGKPAIKAILEAFYGSIRSMRHQEQGVWVNETSGAMEAYVHFTTQDGRDLILPAVSVLRVENGLVQDFRFVMDASPLQQTST